jgi:hypothetical protein
LTGDLTSGSDPEANGLDRPGASIHGLAFCVANPARTRSVIMSLVKPWARTRRASVAPWVKAENNPKSPPWSVYGCQISRRLEIAVV